MCKWKCWNEVFAVVRITNMKTQWWGNLYSKTIITMMTAIATIIAKSNAISTSTIATAALTSFRTTTVKS